MAACVPAISCRFLNASSLHAFGKCSPISARPLKGWRQAVNWLSGSAEIGQLSGRSGHGTIVFHSRPFFRFVRAARLQKLDPVFQPILGKDEHDAVEVLLRDPLPLRFGPELRFERIPVLAGVVTVGPYHQGRVATCFKAISQLPWDLLRYIPPPSARLQTYRVAAAPWS